MCRFKGSMPPLRHLLILAAQYGECTLIPAGSFAPASTLLQHVPGANGGFRHPLMVPHSRRDAVRFGVMIQSLIEESQRTSGSRTPPQHQADQALIPR